MHANNNDENNTTTTTTNNNNDDNVRKRPVDHSRPAVSRDVTGVSAAAAPGFSFLVVVFRIIAIIIIIMRKKCTRAKSGSSSHRNTLYITYENKIIYTHTYTFIIIPLRRAPTPRVPVGIICERPVGQPRRFYHCAYMCVCVCSTT